MNESIDALIFDLDDTLVVEEASAEAALLQTGELARARYGLDPHRLHTALRKSCRDLWHGFPSHPYCRRIGISSREGMWADFTGTDPELKPLRDWAPAYRVESWLKALRECGIDDPELAARLAEAFPRLRREMHVVYPDTIRVLERISGSYSLGLLTNGAPDLQRRKLEGAGLARYFDHVLISGEAGMGKPDPPAFKMLVDRLRSSAERTLMIGDRLATDIQGAQSAGLRAVWLNRSGRMRDSDVIPDFEISTLDGLMPILG